MGQKSLIETLQQLGFTQYEAQCYVGLLRQHPLNGSQLSIICGVPRSMVYQTLNRLEEKAAVVRLHNEEGEPQQFEPVAPKQVIDQLSARYQATCAQLEEELNAVMTTPPAEVVLNLVGIDEILKRTAMLLRKAKFRVSLMGGVQELAELAEEINTAKVREVAVRVVSVGGSPEVQGQIAVYLGENVSAPTRFLIVVADYTQLLIATYSPETTPIAIFTENRTLAQLLSAFLNTEYYLVRQSNMNPGLTREMLTQVLEPEDRERYARILHFLEEQEARQNRSKAEKERSK